MKVYKAYRWQPDYCSLDEEGLPRFMKYYLTNGNGTEVFTSLGAIKGAITTRGRHYKENAYGWIIESYKLVFEDLTKTKETFQYCPCEHCKACKEIKDDDGNPVEYQCEKTSFPITFTYDYFLEVCPNKEKDTD